MCCPRFGPTGQFPRGRVAPDDDGELELGVAADHAHGIVRVEFGIAVEWFGLDTGTARAFAQAIIEKANEVDRRKA